MLAAPRRGDGGARDVSSSQTLSPGGEPQLGRPRFSSPLTTAFVVAHEGRHPMNLLPPPMVAIPRESPWRLVTVRILEGRGLSRGRCPVSRFSLMLSSVKLPRFSTHNGNSPDSRLFSRRNCCRAEIPPSWDGIGPLRLLLWSHRCVRLGMLPSSDGIGPVRLLLRRRSCVRLDRLPSWDGIGPVRLLLSSHRCMRLDMLPSSDGSLPFRA